MIEELREFCEDNNLLVPASMKAVPALRDLTHWTASDPALENEAAPGVRLEVDLRAFVLQRVVYDLRYALLERYPSRAGVDRVHEIGSVPNLSAALALATSWLEGVDEGDLPRRSPVV